MYNQLVGGGVERRRTEPLWVGLVNDWLLVHMGAASCDAKRHLGVMCMAVSCSLYSQVIAALHCCFVRGVVKMAGSPTATNIPALPLSAPMLFKSLLLRHGADSLNAQKEHRVTSF